MKPTSTVRGRLEVIPGGNPGLLQSLDCRPGHEDDESGAFPGMCLPASRITRLNGCSSLMDFGQWAGAQ